MIELQDQQWNESQDVLIRDCLSSKLDGQLGKAEAHFRAMLAPTGPTTLSSSENSKGKSALRFKRFGPWALSVGGTMLAAAWAGVWVGPSLRGISPPESTPLQGTPVDAPLVVEQDVHSQTFDDGTYMAGDNTAVRVLRRRDLERTRWFDQSKKLQREEVVPEDHVVYVQMKTY